jgi:hypothetical protein
MKKTITGLLSLESRLKRFKALGERPPKSSLAASGHHGGEEPRGPAPSNPTARPTSAERKVAVTPHFFSPHNLAGFRGVRTTLPPPPPPSTPPKMVKKGSRAAAMRVKPAATARAVPARRRGRPKAGAQSASASTKGPKAKATTAAAKSKRAVAAAKAKLAAGRKSLKAAKDAVVAAKHATAAVAARRARAARAARAAGRQ